MKVTVGDLLDKLEEYGRDVEVRIMHQPSYPLVEVIGGLYEPDPDVCSECDEPQDAAVHRNGHADFDHLFRSEEDGGPVLFLVADGHPSDGSPYGDKAAWDQMERV